MHAGDILYNRARLTPTREALYDLHTGIRFSYRQLNQRANRTANLLLKLGVQKGDRVSIYAMNCIAYVDLLYAVGKIGAIIAPLNWRLSVPELIYIANDLESRVILVGPDYADSFAKLQEKVSFPHVLSLEGAQLTSASSYEQELEKVSADEPPRPADLSAEDTYCIMYTSGTTGRPKGAMLPHRQFLFNCINLPACWGLSEQDVSPVFTPLFHAGGLFAYLTPLLYLGGRIILARIFESETSLRIIESEKCTVVLGVPTLYQMWHDAKSYPQVKLDHVNYFNVGGAPIPKPLMEAWRSEKGITFRQGYGLTEVGPNCFAMTNEESFVKTGSVGKPIFHSQIRLVDPEGRDVPIGEAGEIVIKGPHVCTGYWRKPEATAGTITDGWFHTGDMGRMDQDGFFYIAGRIKEMIKSGGENIYCAEVEAVFNDHEAIQECALIGKPHEKWGEVGLLVVKLKNGQPITEADLKDYAGTCLAKYKIPKEIAFVDQLPHNDYGKVLRSELKKQFKIGNIFQSGQA